MGAACGCDELERPPSRSNMSLWAIIELVIMGVCGVLCLVELIDILNSGKSLNNVYLILRIVVDALIVIGLVLIIIGLFCASGPSSIRSGILCFVIGAIITLVVLILDIVNGEKLTFYSFCYIVLLFFLAYLLWRQSAHL